jgi:excisionase family DNA binding protein
VSKVTTSEAAEILSVDDSTVFRWVDKGLLSADRITRKRIIMIDVDELKRFAQSNGHRFDDRLAKQYAAE